jgi:hypothetical protein
MAMSTVSKTRLGPSLGESILCRAVTACGLLGLPGRPSWTV